VIFMRPFDLAWILLKQQQCTSIRDNPHTRKRYRCILPEGHAGPHRYEQEVESPDIPEEYLTHNPFDVPDVPPPPPKEDPMDYDFNDY